MNTRRIGIRLASGELPHLSFTLPVDNVTGQDLHHALEALTDEEQILLEASQRLTPSGDEVMRQLVNRMRVSATDRTYAEDNLKVHLETLEWILAHGTTFTGLMTPPEYLGPLGHCYRNSLEMAFWSSRMRFQYVEGVAVPPVGQLMRHAWNTNAEYRISGHPPAIERTFPRGDLARYFGIVIPNTVIKELESAIPASGTSIAGYFDRKIWKYVRPILERHLS
jgi:hypothetical protein